MLPALIYQLTQEYTLLMLLYLLHKIEILSFHQHLFYPYHIPSLFSPFFFMDTFSFFEGTLETFSHQVFSSFLYGKQNWSVMSFLGFDLDSRHLF